MDRQISDSRTSIHSLGTNVTKYTYRYDYVPGIYTDRSYSITTSIEAVFRPDLQKSKATASIIIKDSSTDWIQKAVYIIHIYAGEQIQATSAYTMEFLALVAAFKLQITLLSASSNAIGLAPVRSDANSIVSMLRHRRKKLCQASKKHHLLLQCADNSIFRGYKLPIHVKGHVEKRKPGKENTWTHHEWGNYIADRAAGVDYDTLRKKGLQIHIHEVNARDIYSAILDQNQ